MFIDVLSRYVFARLLKRKTPEEAAEALDDIIHKTGRRPWTLTTDRGLEFKGRPFQDCMRKHDIHHKYSTSPDVKCAIVERYIRTLKSRIWRHFTRHKTQRYVDVLQDFVK